MLNRILGASNLDARTCASLLGISEVMFGEWVAEQRPIPESQLPLLSAVLGIKPELLRPSARQLRPSDADITPAIWYKFRSDRVAEADRECVLLIRELGFHMHELDVATRKSSARWEPVFEAVRRSTDLQAPPREQGRQAARNFRQATGLDQCATGIGEQFRGYLRTLGVLVIENPIKDSELDGCAFFVGASPKERPSIFANSFRTTWFRRNTILMHELAHAIFDAESAGAALDFVHNDPNVARDLAEERADAFAQEALLPKEVLRHLGQMRSMRWDELTDLDLARLIADSSVEKRVVLAAAVEAGFLSPDSARRADDVDISKILPTLTDRALSTKEFVQRVGAEADAWLAKRTTTIPSRSLRLPSRYVDDVLAALDNAQISRGKAARMLMIEENELGERFPALAEGIEA